MSVLTALRLSKSPAAAFVALGLCWGVFAAFVPEIKAGIGASDALFGTLLLGSALGLVSAMWLAPRVDGWLGDRGMALASRLLVVAFLLPALAPGPVWFFFAMVAVGTASGLTDVMMNARVSELEARAGRSLMNVNHGMFSAAYASAALATGIAREAQVAPVMIFAGVGVLVLLLSMRMKVSIERAEDHPVPEGSYPVGPIVICGLIVLIAFMSEATVETWSALHIERTLGGGAAEGALGPAMLGLTMAFGRFSGQALTERMRDTTVVIWAAAISAVGVLTAAAAPSPWVAYLGFGTLGLGVSVIGPIGLALVGRLVAPRYRTEAISRAAVMGFSGFFVAPLLMGGVSELFGLRFAFAAVALLLLPVPLLVLAIRRRERAMPGGL